MTVSYKMYNRQKEHRTFYGEKQKDEKYFGVERIVWIYLYTAKRHITEENVRTFIQVQETNKNQFSQYYQ